MSFLPPLLRVTSMRPISAGSVSLSGPAGSVGSSGDDYFPSRPRSSSDASDFSVGGSPISPPGGMPPIRCVKPSYKDACDARDASRAQFERHSPDAKLDASTVQKDTEHLGRTVVTVRNYLNASVASEIDALDAAFGAASGSETSIAKPLQDLDRLFAKTGTLINGILDPAVSKLIDEARSHRDIAHCVGVPNGVPVTHDMRCTSAQAALRLLGEARDALPDRHMREAEDNHADMRDTIAAQDADIFQSQGSGVLRSLDYVLQHGSGAKPEKFDMDGFVQLLYRKESLGSTISSAASLYSASQTEIRVFVGNISDTDTQQTADKVATEMFRACDNIDFGAYLREIMAKVSEPHIPTAQEALKKAMKYMIPITIGNRIPK